jgi:hypothetical protein
MNATLFKSLVALVAVSVKIGDSLIEVPSRSGHR